MNRALILLCFLSFALSVYAQVWTEPAFPTKFDDVTIYFDATQGNAALAGFTGDVYAHTGVITSQSTNGNDWRYVVGNWGTADPRVLMTRVEDDLYTLSYNITDFYNIPMAEEVLKLAFVFRNVSGSIVGRAADGSDIFTDVYPPTDVLFLDIRSPEVDQDVILRSTDSLMIDVVVSDTAQLDIYDNDVLIFSEITEQATFYQHPVGTGNHTLRIEASRDTNSVLSIQKYFVLEDNPALQNPPAGTVAGLNYYTDSTYLFQLVAPLKEYAFVLTSANDYSPSEAFQMHLAEDGSTWWLEVPRDSFSNGRRTYQYLVSDGVRVPDPHSEVVLDPQHDPWVAASVMATLPAYPDGQTSGIVTAFDAEYEPFDFQATGYERPEKQKLVIYEMLMRDFLTDHSYPSLLDTLDYFERLGVNAIELMPVSEFEGNDSWGYNVSFHMATDKYYGTRDQLKAFIDAAHARGIAVILDVVFNHTFAQGPLAQMYWDAANFRPAANSPYLNVVARHPFNVGYDINHESIYTKQWVKRILAYWLTEFKVDGFRFDLSKGMTQFNSGNNVGLMGQFDASRIAILKDYADHIWSVDSTAFVILEHFAENSEEIALSDEGMMLWGNLNFQFSEAAMGYASDLEGVDYTFRGWNHPHLIGYMESHDEERMVYRLNNFGDSEGDYNTRETTTALQRVEAACAIFYSVPGPKMLWEFGELGYDYSINWCTNGSISDQCRLVPKPVRWDYLNDYRREHLRSVIAALTYLHTSVPTFATSDFVFNDGNFFLKTIHLNHPEMDAVVLANFRVIDSEINPKFQYTGTWYEYFTGDSLVVTDTQERLPFGPGEYRIYTSQRLTPPDGYITSTTDATVLPLDLYPTILSDQQELYTILPTDRDVERITLSDLSGSIIRDLRFVQNGTEVMLILPEPLPAGMYLVGLKTAERYFTGKVVRQ